MTLQISFFNIWAIVVCIISNMVIGALWYSPVLFGNTWLRLTGKKQDDISKADSNKAMLLGLIPATVLIILLAFMIAFINTSTLIDGLIIGSITSAGFIGMSAFNLVLYEDRSFKLTLINTGYSFVSLNVAAVILTLWK